MKVYLLGHFLDLLLDLLDAGQVLPKPLQRQPTNHN
jgi:hypothetical protein